MSAPRANMNDVPISRVDPATSHTGNLSAAESQQASTMPGDGHSEPADQLPFKEQVKGYAKLIAGKTFGNEKEVELGEAKLRGELDPPSDLANQASNTDTRSIE